MGSQTNKMYVYNNKPMGTSYALAVAASFSFAICFRSVSWLKPFLALSTSPVLCKQ